MENEIDDEVMARFTGLADDMRANRLAQELGGEEAPPLEESPEDPGDAAALEAMLGSDESGVELAPQFRPQGEYDAPDRQWKSGKGGLGGMGNVGQMASMMGK
jgi:hypothetical protein